MLQHACRQVFNLDPEFLQIKHPSECCNGKDVLTAAAAAAAAGVLLLLVLLIVSVCG